MVSWEGANRAVEIAERLDEERPVEGFHREVVIDQNGLHVELVDNHFKHPTEENLGENF